MEYLGIRLGEQVTAENELLIEDGLLHPG